MDCVVLLLKDTRNDFIIRPDAASYLRKQRIPFFALPCCLALSMDRLARGSKLQGVIESNATKIRGHVRLVYRPEGHD